MLYMIHGVDGTAAEQVRTNQRQPHLDFLDANSDIVVLAGATLSDDGSRQTGSVMIINVASLAEAQAFVQDEPFCKAGMFATLTMTRMRKGRWNPDAAPQEVQ